MIKYTIHFVYNNPSAELLNNTGKSVLGLNSPIRKHIASGTSYNEEVALFECNCIVGGDLKFSESDTFYNKKGKCFSKYIGKSSFHVKMENI